MLDSDTPPSLGITAMHSILRSCFGRALAIALIVPLLILDSDAQIVIQTGDDLAAAVASAPDNSFIEIQSNATFTGTLAWQGKGLTIHAGVGFKPTIVGDIGEPAVHLTSGTPDTKVVLIGLTLVPGVVESNAMILANDGTIASWIRAAFLDCDFQGGVYSYGLGNTHFTGTFDDCKMEDLRFDGDDSFDATAVMQDCKLTGSLYLFSADSAHFDVTVRRSRLTGLSGICNDLSTGELLVESSLVSGGGIPSPGISFIGAINEPSARFVNVTVTGYGVGVSVWPNATLENMLVFGNSSSDLAPQTTSAQISNSFISDGAHDGLNGNFTGNPQLNGTFAPLPGSIVFDSANSLAADLGLFDLNGDARSQDGDGDLIASVNVGAVETKGGVATFYNGNGINATDYTLLTGPLLGKAFRSSVALPSMTTVSIVAIDLFSPPLSLPGVFLGETFILYSPGLRLDFASGDGMHVINVPDIPAIAGAMMMVQGARIVDVGGVATIEALNGFNIVVGR